MSDREINRIVIVGGGSAGWLVAGTLAAQYCRLGEKSLQVTLIESSDIKTVGVGEGTWPSMRNTLNQMGISESDFIKHCHASYKQGTKFVGWRDGSEEDVYYHPFTTPTGYEQIDIHAAWQQFSPSSSYADTVNVQSHVIAAGRAPKQIATPDYASVTNYGYHLDANLFADLLQTHCTNTLNVEHIVDNVEGIVSAKTGDIESIATQSHGNIKGDLFIDCSGSHSILLGKHFGIEQNDISDVLFNDSAVATHIPYDNEEQEIASATISTATEAGWIWDIGLSSRRGAGHTFSSKYCTDEKAEQILRDYVAKQAGKTLADSLSYRVLKFKPGYRDKFWHKNCVAVGMSAGFIEPLEASALAMVELSAMMIRDELPATRKNMDIIATRFNQKFTYRWQRIVDFLKLHYVLSQRQEQPYWRDNHLEQTIPQSLSELLSIWQYQPPSRHDLLHKEEVFPSASYQYVLYGMGFETQAIPRYSALQHQAHAERMFQENNQKIKDYLNGLPTNRTLLNHINRR